MSDKLETTMKQQADLFDVVKDLIERVTKLERNQPSNIDKPERYPNPPSIDDRKRIQERENDQTRTTSRRI